MSDQTVYMIGNFDIHDAATYRFYEKGFFPILKRHGGEFITFDDESKTLEGETPMTGRVVMFKFPNQEAAEAWYNDPEYQAISEHRRAGTTLKHLTLVHGMAPR